MSKKTYDNHGSDNNIILLILHTEIFSSIIDMVTLNITILVIMPSPNLH